MRSVDVVVEIDRDTGFLVWHVPRWPGAHSHAESLDELQRNLQQVLSMLLDDSDPEFEFTFIGDH